ncbi:hypothetical protein [Pelagerythrobacter rhizovicinus]|uniref:DUF1049 domain-containing protein n=1 Tax=Pelagerythrobacter rhizovicinus TaxID=2268576 RepID=A0A4Q2KLE9_9SPHN|nr:hypothetical protein [Pelagerythrobacter rhizovicinus]RXZ63951.1 hypothetical protein ETX26_08375 [Pelagerythrobacter rhizovicinus]
MQVVRTIVWVLLLVVLLVFSAFNWRPIELTIWQGLVLETKIPALVVVSFLLGLVPMWLLHQGSKWRLHRRISSLETAHRTAVANAAAASPPPEPVREPVREPAHEPVREPSPSPADPAGERPKDPL